MAAVGVGNSLQRGIQLSKVSPEFLHANSTSHTWAFSAFAEIIDNAYDPDVCASELLIDKLEINGETCLIFLDNGAGMDTEKLLKMLSFGFCDKHMYERMPHLPIGHYGNGFKSGSMRLGKDALVFTRCPTSANIGFLSQSYLKAIEADSVFIPVVTYRLPNLERIKSEQSKNNLKAILNYSVFHTEQDLKDELHALEGSMTGTKIIISNLKRLKDDRLELDFSSDETDIRCPEAHEVDLTSVYHRPVQLPTSEYKHSLKEYCSILFLRPRMKITIRGRRVKSKLISKSLSSTEIDSYKPTWLDRPLKITFGFNCQKDKTEDYGIMLYHRNRLIKAFEKVGYQRQPNDLGIGVVGVAQVDFLQPTHNKQDFNKDEKFNSVMAAFANKLNDYWNEKKEITPAPLDQESVVAAPDWTWAQCDMCLKWRRLPDGVDKDLLPDQWFCRLNPDATHNRCEIPEEPEDEDLAVKATYTKTFRRIKEEKKRRERFVKEKQFVEAQNRLQLAGSGNNSFPEISPAMTNLHKALVEAKEREEQQKLLITQMMEEKKLIEEQLKSFKSKPKKKGQTLVTQPLGSHGNSIALTPVTKRKGETAYVDSSTGAKVFCFHERTNLQSSDNNLNNHDIPNHSSPARRHNEKNKNNSNASKSSSHSPLKVKVGDLINRNNKLDPKASSNQKKMEAASSKKNERFVDLSEDIDYEITLNEDYDSDEDMKPNLDELNAALKEKSKSKETEIYFGDAKPDRNVLDRAIKEKSVVADKEPRAEGDEASPVVTKGVQEKETRVTGVAANKNPTATSTIPSDKSPRTAPDDVHSSVNSPSSPECEDSEMPPENVLSSNVNKVMAALENKIKKSRSKDDGNSADHAAVLKNPIIHNEKTLFHGKECINHDGSDTQMSDVSTGRSHMDVGCLNSSDDHDKVTKAVEKATFKELSKIQPGNEDDIGSSHCRVDDSSSHRNSCDDLQLEKEMVFIDQQEDSFGLVRKDEETQGDEGKASTSRINSSTEKNRSSSVECDENDCRGIRNNTTQKDENRFSNSENVLDPNSEAIRCEEMETDSEEISKERFHRFLNDVHHLLSLLCPDTQLGDVGDVEETVRAMIQVYQEGSQSQFS